MHLVRIWVNFIAQSSVYCISHFEGSTLHCWHCHAEQSGLHWDPSILPAPVSARHNLRYPHLRLSSRQNSGAAQYFSIVNWTDSSQLSSSRHIPPSMLVNSAQFGPSQLSTEYTYSQTDKPLFLVDWYFIFMITCGVVIDCLLLESRGWLGFNGKSDPLQCQICPLQCQTWCQCQLLFKLTTAVRQTRFTFWVENFHTKHFWKS